MNKVHDWELWDWKTIKEITLGIIILGTVALLIFKGADWYRYFRFKSLPLSTIANIQAATPVETMNNGKLGTTIKVSFYKIEYSFFVDGQTFFHTEMISASIWSDFTRKNNKPFKVNYNPSEPDECLLNLYDL